VWWLGVCPFNPDYYVKYMPNPAIKYSLLLISLCCGSCARQNHLQMLRTKPLQELLSQTLSESIHTAVLATPQGTVLAHAINFQFEAPHADGPRRQARSLAALSTVIWKNYAGIENPEELWTPTPNGTVNGDRSGLLWTAIECEVFTARALVD
jgi:hypothetical protein